LRLQLAIFLEHFACNLLRNVGFQVLLLFEVSIEEAPRGERIRRLWFEQRNDQAPQGLAGGHDQRIAPDLEVPGLPCAFQRSAKTAFEGYRQKVTLLARKASTQPSRRSASSARSESRAGRT